MLGANAPAVISEETGVVNALLSDRNRSGFEQVQSNAFPGKGLPVTAQAVPEIEVSFQKPVCGDVSETQLELCDEGTNYGDPIGYRKYTIDPAQVLSDQFRIAQDDFDRICEGRDERVSMQLARTAKKLRYALEKKIIGLLYAAAGNYTSGTNSVTTPNVLNLMGINSGQAYANAAAFVNLKSEYRKMHSMDAPIVVGDDELARYFDLRGMAGLGANALFANPTDFGGFTPATSLFLNGEINNLGGTGAHLLSWLPGTAQLVTWNKFTGDRERFADDYTKTTINVGGLNWDYTMNYDKCDDVWDIGVGITYDLFHLLDELAPCYDWNYILHWGADCGEETCENIFGVPTEGSASE
jgi:hypothetical protein